MRTIWKFPVPVADDVIHLNMPANADVLCVQIQGTDAVIWAEVRPDAPIEMRRFQWFGTGHQIDAGERRYVGTVQMAGGSLVFHLFEVVR